MNNKSQVTYSGTVSDCDRLERALSLLGIRPDSPTEHRRSVVKEIEHIAIVLCDESLASECHTQLIHTNELLKSIT